MNDYETEKPATNKRFCASGADVVTISIGACFSHSPGRRNSAKR